MVNSNFRRIIHTTRLSLSLERRSLLYGYYNSEQQFVQVKICTAVDKEKGITEKQRGNRKLAIKLINAEIAVFICRKLLIFGVECGIMISDDTMY